MLALPVLAAAAVTHTIQSGETLSGIADTYGVGLDAIASANEIEDVDLIFEGQVLRIPGSQATVPLRTYTVEPGDSLSYVADLYGVSLNELIALNEIENPDIIQPGDILAIPSTSLLRAVSVASAAAALHPGIDLLLRAAEREHGLPRGLLLALAWQESGWQQHLMSDAGAVGIMQVLPETADWAHLFLFPEPLDWRTDTGDNVALGAAFLRHLLDEAGGDTFRAVAAYYQGRRSLQQFGPFDETLVYVENVLALVPYFQ
jgi:LysM repeat protein